MADTDSASDGLHIGDLVAVAAAATTLITVLTTLAVTGALQQMQRDHGVYLVLALGLVLLGAAIWAVVAMTKPAEAKTSDGKKKTSAPLRPHAQVAVDTDAIEELLPPERAQARVWLRDRADSLHLLETNLTQIRDALPARPDDATRYLHEVRNSSQLFRTLYGSELDELEKLLTEDPKAARALAATYEETLPPLLAFELRTIDQRLAAAGSGTTWDAVKDAEQQHAAADGARAKTKTPFLHRPSVQTARALMGGAAVATFIAGIVVGAIGMVITQRAQERPSVAATIKDNLLSGTAAAHNLGSEGRLATKIVGVNVQGKALQEETRWYAISGPDSSGTATQKFTYSLDGSYDAYAVSASTSSQTDCFERTVKTVKAVAPSSSATKPGAAPTTTATTTTALPASSAQSLFEPRAVAVRGSIAEHNFPGCVVFVVLQPGMPAIGAPKLTPAKPTAGKDFTLEFPVLRKDTGDQLNTGTISCEPSIGGQALTVEPQNQSVADGLAQCTIKVPAEAKNKQLHVRVTIKNGTLAGSREDEYLVT